MARDDYAGCKCRLPNMEVAEPGRTGRTTADCLATPRWGQRDASQPKSVGDQTVVI